MFHGDRKFRVRRKGADVMSINTVQKTLVNRALFVRGLYWLMTAEEREYFWVREADAVLRAHQSTDAPTEKISGEIGASGR